MLRFLLLCKRRLDARGFDPKSTLYQTLSNVYNALHHLHMDLHYRSCGHGVGRSPDEE